VRPGLPSEPLSRTVESQYASSAALSGAYTAAGGAAPSFLRLKARDGATSSGGVKLVRPPSLAALLEAATRKAHLLWPRQPGTAAVAIFDEDNCEVDDDNYVLVEAGAVLYVSGGGGGAASTGGAARAGSPTPSTNPFD